MASSSEKTGDEKDAPNGLMEGLEMPESVKKFFVTKNDEIIENYKQDVTTSDEDGSAILRSRRKGPFGLFTCDNQYGQSVGLCLVLRGDKNQCVFDHTHRLSKGMTVQLTLKSHPGIGISTQKYHWVKDKSPHTRKNWLLYEYKETCGGKAEDAIYVSYKDENYIVLHQVGLGGVNEPTPFVLDVDNWNVYNGAPVNFVNTYASPYNVKEGKFGSAGGGDDWFINSNGTISQKHLPEYCLGFKTKGDHHILPLKYRGLKFLKKDYSLRARILYFKDQILSMLNARWFTRNIEHNLIDNPDEVYERLMAEWANLSVVSTLMLGIAFESFGNTVENPDNIEFWDIEASQFIALLNFFSILADFVAIMSLLLYGMALNTLPSKLTGEFVSQFSLFLSVPEVFTLVGLLLYMITATMTGLVMHGPSFTVGVVGLFAAFAFSGLFLFFLPFTLDREGGLWEKARKLNDEAAMEELRKSQGLIASTVDTLETKIEDALCCM